MSTKTCVNGNNLILHKVVCTMYTDKEDRTEIIKASFSICKVNKHTPGLSDMRQYFVGNAVSALPRAVVMN